jgi:hypothetical protein
VSGSSVSTDSLAARIEKMRDDVLRRFQTIVGLAAVCSLCSLMYARFALRRAKQIQNTDRNISAITQYQIDVETSALVSG